MTIEEVLAEIEEIKPNAYDNNMLITWLSELDGRIFEDVVKTHHREIDDTMPYFEPYTNTSQELLVKFPHTDIYRNYLSAMIDYSNGETDRYQNSMLVFNSAYTSFVNDYNRTHRPIGQPLRFF